MVEKPAATPESVIPPAGNGGSGDDGVVTALVDRGGLGKLPLAQRLVSGWMMTRNESVFPM